MPPIPAEVSRLVLYHQTIRDKAGNHIPIRPLASTGVTHLYVAAIHLNDRPEDITLNDHHPDDDKYKQLWEDVEYLQNQKVTVMGMLGGAAKGSYERLHRDFQSFYPVLEALIRKRKLQGLDLDIEEPVPLSTVTNLITRLKSSFGASFIITLAPVMPALLPRSRRLTSLTYRLLHPELPPPAAIIRPLINAKFLKSHRHLSGFSHFELEASEFGKLIEWYNVQLYCGWGDASDARSYEALVTAGWDPRRLVLGVVTNPENGAGYVPLEKFKDVIKTLTSKYGTKFGGVMGWEYFNAYRDKDINASTAQGGPKPWMWAFEISHSLQQKPEPYDVAEAKALNFTSESSNPSPSMGESSNAPLSAPTPNAPVPQPADKEDAAEANEQAKFVPNEDHVQELVNMGFDRAEAIFALESVDGDLNAAGALLFGD